MFGYLWLRLNHSRNSNEKRRFFISQLLLAFAGNNQGSDKLARSNTPPTQKNTYTSSQYFFVSIYWWRIAAVLWAWAENLHHSKKVVMISLGFSLFYSKCICIFSILISSYLLQEVTKVFYIVASLELHFFSREIPIYRIYFLLW